MTVFPCADYISCIYLYKSKYVLISYLFFQCSLYPLISCIHLVPPYFLVYFKKLSCLFSYYHFECSLYILKSNPLSDVFFANIFFHCMACLYILLTVFFAVQRFKIWQSQIQVFLSIVHLVLD